MANGSENSQSWRKDGFSGNEDAPDSCGLFITICFLEKLFSTIAQWRDLSFLFQMSLVLVWR